MSDFKQGLRLCSQALSGFRAITCAQLFLVSVLLSGCATSSHPKHPNNICSIYRQNRSWYKAAMHTEKHWGVPSYVPMAMMYQESGYHSRIKTKHNYVFFGLIPWGRVTSAYGYPQAVNGVWREYQADRGRFRHRSNFKDAIDFMGWYINNAHKTLGIPRDDAFSQYIAYHDGIGAYRRERGHPSASITRISEGVALRAARYSNQYMRCEKSLRHRSWFGAIIHFLF